MTTDGQVNGFLPLYHHREIAAWQKENGGAPLAPKDIALKVLEEMVELCYTSGASLVDVQEVVNLETHKAIMKNETEGRVNPKGILDEIGDVLAGMEVLCQYNNISGLTAVNYCLMRIRDRKWTPDLRGILRRPR